jgi:serine/threonine protein kinase
MRLGSCEILERLGAGGMGEVYRGRDTRLGRDVAVKALPDSFARDPERLARFEREAQVLATLKHSKLAVIHELKEVDGSKYLILELVEGETLAERIARGPLALDDALSIAAQIADALDAAHGKGITNGAIVTVVSIKPLGASIQISAPTPLFPLRGPMLTVSRGGRLLSFSALTNTGGRGLTATPDHIVVLHNFGK